jgi:hypothetical protein
MVHWLWPFDRVEDTMARSRMNRGALNSDEVSRLQKNLLRFVILEASGISRAERALIK